jgi:hypothetical protein
LAENWSGQKSNSATAVSNSGLAAIAYNIEFMAHRPDHLNQFGHLLRGTEFWMFSLPVAAV